MFEEQPKALQQKIKSFATDAIAQQNPSGWFEPLYAEAQGDTAQVPWVKNQAHPYLQQWLQAYEESLAEAKISLKQIIAEGKTALPIVHAEIDFLRPLFCGDRIQVNLNVSLINNSEFAITYQISPFDNLERILVTAQTRHVCINPQLRRRIDLTAEMLEWLNLFQ